MVEKENEQSEEQAIPLASTEENLIPNSSLPPATNTCCQFVIENAYGLFLYFLLALFLVSLCVALILGGGRFGAYPVISTTGAFISLGISVSAAVGLLIMSIHWSLFLKDANE